MLINAVKQFMINGKQDVDEYNSKQMALYFALQLEELAEKAEVLGLYKLSTLLEHYSMRGKNGEFKDYFDSLIQKKQRADLLDADIDLAWVSLGAAFSMGADVPEAVRKVVAANMDKFRNGYVTDDAGKIVKPVDWEPPNLEDCVV